MADFGEDEAWAVAENQPDGKNQNRVDPIREFEPFIARLRELIGFSGDSRGEPQGGSELPSSESRSKEDGKAAGLFEKLARELFVLQFERNPIYRKLCEARKVSPRTVRSWADIPAVPTAAFKEFELTSIPVEERTIVFHSSGTTGQVRSRHFHCPASIAIYEESVRAGFQAKCGRYMNGARLVFLTPSGAQAPHSSLVHMFEVIRREAGAGEAVFLGRVGAGAGEIWETEMEATAGILRRACEDGRPVALFGTAFLFVHLLDYLAGRDLCLRLPSGSSVFETGGYKGRSRSMSRRELHGLIKRRLGVPTRRVVCEYGMGELSSQAYAWENEEGGGKAEGERIFRFPPWARARVISPETGEEVPEGGTGLLRIHDLANVYSVMGIQTEDLGIRRGTGFELLGRAEAAEPRGCSLMAN